MAAIKELYDYKFYKTKTVSKFHTGRTYTDSTRKNYYDYSFNAVITSCNPNPINNSSTLEIKFPVTWNYTGSTTGGHGVSFSTSFDLNVDIKTKTGIIASESATILGTSANPEGATISLEIKHSDIKNSIFENDDNIQIVFTIPSEYSGVAATVTTVGFRVPELPLPGTITCDKLDDSKPYYIGQNFKVNITMPVTMRYQFKMRYKIALNGGKIITSDYFLWTSDGKTNSFNTTTMIPHEIMYEMPDTIYATVTFECATYALGVRAGGEPSVGYEVYLGQTTETFRIEIDPKWKPTVNSLVISPVHTIEGALFNMDEYITKVSHVNLKVDFKTYYGAEIAYCRVYSQKRTILDWPSDMDSFDPNAATFDWREDLYSAANRENFIKNGTTSTNPLSISGYYAYYVEITDTRGRHSERFPISETIFVDYREKIDGTFDAYRTDESEERNDDGQWIRCTLNMDVTNIMKSYPNGNAVLRLYKKLGNGEFYLVDMTAPKITITGTGDRTINGVVIFKNTEPQTDYLVEFEMGFGESSIKSTKIVPSNNIVLDIAQNGSVAIGGKARDDIVRFTVNMNQWNEGHIKPLEPEKYDLGDSSHRWKTIYSVNALNTSDRRFKDNINYLGMEEINDLHEFYKTNFKLATFNFKGQDKTEYGFITQDYYDDSVGEMFVIKNEDGDMYSVGSYISSIAGALQYEINLRDNQINKLLMLILALQNEIEDLKK